MDPGGGGRPPLKRKRFMSTPVSIHPPPSTQEQAADPTQASPCHLDPLLLRSWGFPQPILDFYLKKGISRFFDWQVECLCQDGVLEGTRNLVYSAPTSAGKSMVADVLLFKTLLERSRKAIIILPFVSITIEKVQSLKGVLRKLGLRIDSFAGQTNPRGGLARVDVAVCTIEKANNMINRLMEEDRLDEIGLIVVDELHMIGDSSRGYLLELLLTKIRYSIWQANAREAEGDTDVAQPPQIVGMSATIPNLADLANWLQAQLYITEYRPVPLHERLVLDDKIITVDGQLTRKLSLSEYELKGNDYVNLIFMAIETVVEGFSALVFGSTKHSCEALARLVAENIFELGGKKRYHGRPLARIIGEQLVQQLDGNKIKALHDALKRCSAGLDSSLESVTRFGVAFHHAGLAMEERALIEQAFRDGTIRILCSTTTLSAGVNLPARRVLIASPYDFRQSVLEVTTYRQMIGRAGRKGIDTLGESYLFFKSSQLPVIQQNLLKANFREVDSKLIRFNNAKTDSPLNSNDVTVSESLQRAILEAIANGAASTDDEIVAYLKCTFFASLLEQKDEGGSQELLPKAIELVLEHLVKEFFLTRKMNEAKSLSISSLGRAVVASGLSPTDGKFLLRELERARNSLCLLNDLHLVYEVTPTYVSDQLESIDWSHYLKLYSKLDKDMKRVSELIGISEGFIVNRISVSNVSNTASDRLTIHKRFYAALALYDLVQEMTLGAVATKYRLTRGLLQTLQQQAASFAGMLTTFCNRLGWSSLELLIEQFAPRLTFGVQRDLIDLMRIPCLTSTIARQLHSRSLDTVVSLIYLKPSDLEEVLMSVATSPLPNSDSKASKSKGTSAPMAAQPTDPTKAKLYIASIDKYVLVSDLAKMVIEEARALVEADVGQSLNFDELSGNPTALHKSPRKSPLKISPTSPFKSPLKSPYKSAAQTPTKAPALKLEPRSPPETPAKLFSSTPNKDTELPKKMFGTDTEIKDDPDVKDEETPLASSKRRHSAIKSPSILFDDDSDILREFTFSKVMARGAKCSTSSPSTSSPPTSRPRLTSAKDEEFDVDDEEDMALLMAANEAAIPPSTSHKSKDESLKKIDELSDISFPEELISPRPSTSTAANALQTIDEEPSEKFRPLHSPELFDDLDLDDIFLNRSPEMEFPDSPEMSEVGDTPAEKITSRFFEQLAPDNSTLKREHPLPSLSTSVRGEEFNVIPIQSDIECQNALDLLFDYDSVVAVHFVIRTPPRGRGRITHYVAQSYDHVPKGYGNNAGLWLHREQAFLAEFIMTRANRPEVYHFYGKHLPMLRSMWQNKLQNIEPEQDDKFNTSTAYSYSDRKIHILTYDIKSTLSILHQAFNFDPRYLVHRIDWHDLSVPFWLLEPESDPLTLLKSLPTVPVTKLIQITQQFNKSAEVECFQKYIHVKTFGEPVGLLVLLFDLVPGSLQVLKKRNLFRAYRLIELPARLCIYLMETTGVPIDAEYLEQLQAKVSQHKQRLKDQVQSQTGRVNLASPKEVAEVLYKQFALLSSYFDVSAKAKSGVKPTSKLRNPNAKLSKHLGTSKVALLKLQEACKGQSQLPGMIVEWRKLNHVDKQSLHSVRAKLVTEENKGEFQTLVFTRFCEWTLTGRITMQDPNLISLERDFSIKNVLPNEEEGTEGVNNDDGPNEIHFQVRRIVKAREGHRLLAADYCQLELRILAHFSGDQELLATLNNPANDVFKAIAASWKEINIDEVTSEMRQAAKEICYGIIYGMGDETLAERLDLTADEAAQYKNTFFERYRQVDEFISRTIEECRSKSYVETIAGRTRSLSKISSRNGDERAQASRQAVNTRIQGSAADILKIAMIAVENAMMGAMIDARPLLQMHDELMYEVSENHLEQAAKLLRTNMEKVSEALKVILPVKVKTGQNWSEMSEYTETAST